jgi:uncharacterized membrane protein YecN with MAPEG domain
MLPITSIFASFATLMYIALAFRVIAIRRSRRISLGAGSDARLETRMRQHGNFSEYVPLTLLLMGLAESQGASPVLLIALGLALLVSRAAHAFGLGLMSKPIGLTLRSIGMVSCFTVLIVLVITLLSLTLF